MSHIETTRLILRSIVPEDAKDLSFLSTRPIVAHFMSDMVWPTEDAARAWVNWLSPMMNAEEPCMLFGIELKSDHQLIGYIGVAPKKEIEDEIEILYAVSDDFQGRGYAVEAGKAMVWWAFEEAGQDRLSAIVKPANKASRRVVEKLGFVYCDTRILPYDGEDCAFDYFRLYHTDSLPGPEWDIPDLYKPEAMDAFFEDRIEGYDSHMLIDGDGSYEKFGEAIPRTDEPVRILDLGCGTGIELNYIWKQVPKAHITCVDMTPGMLKRLLDTHPNDRDRMTIVEASYLEMAYPEATYDLIVSSATMHHLFPGEKLPVYGNILKALKPGGLYIENDFIVDAPQAEQYRRRYELITARLPKRGKAGEYHIDIPCTIEEQYNVLRQAGFGEVLTFFEDIKPRGSFAILKARKL